MNSYFDEANDEIKRDGKRRGHRENISKMECDICGKVAKRLNMVETKDGRLSICRECEREIK